MEEELRTPEVPPKEDPLGLRFFRTPEDQVKGLPTELVEDLKRSALEAFPGIQKLTDVLPPPEEENPFDPPVPTPDVEVEGIVQKILTDKDVEGIMEKCFFHRLKMEGDNPQDWCHYRHDYCMIGNHAYLPLEKTAVADVCIRGY
jgi:hypothetical protein